MLQLAATSSQFPPVGVDHPVLELLSSLETGLDVIEVIVLHVFDRLSYSRYQTVSCPDSALSLDECWIRPESQCRSHSHGYHRRGQTHGTVRLRCGDEPNNATLSSSSSSASGQRCARVVQSAAEIKASSANCENLNWFVCEAKPEIIHDVQS